MCHQILSAKTPTEIFDWVGGGSALLSLDEGGIHAIRVSVASFEAVVDALAFTLIPHPRKCCVL